MRILLIIACLANVAFAFGSLPWMPNPMVILFDNKVPVEFGSPIGWAIQRSIEAIVIGTVGLCNRWFATWFVWTLPFMPMTYFLPNSTYWVDYKWGCFTWNCVNEKNRPQAIRCFAVWTELSCVAILLCHLFLQWSHFQAHQMVPPQYTTFNEVVTVVSILVTATFQYFIAFYLSFRLPKTETQ